MAEYDPHDHRDVKKPLNNFEAYANMLKGNLGSGIVALPIAMKHAGWVIGIVLIVFVGLLTIHTLTVMVDVEYRLCKRKQVPLLQYAYAMEESHEIGPECAHKCGKTAKISTFLLMIVLQVGACVSYIVFGAGVLQSFVDSFLDEKILNKNYYILITFVPYFLILFALNMKTIAPLSLAANICMVVALILSCRFIFVDLEPLSKRDALGDLQTVALSFATAVFSMQAVGVIAHVEYVMENPKKFRGIVGMFPLVIYTCILIYTVIGFFGYWRFGDEVKGNFILNLPQKDTITRIINVLFLFSMLVSFGLNAVVPVDILWEEWLQEKFETHEFWWNFLLRIIYLIITYVCAIGLPNLGLVVSLTGAVTMSLLGIVFPMIMDIYERYDTSNYGTINWILIKSIIIIIIGIAAFNLGIYSGVIETIKHRTAD